MYQLRRGAPSSARFVYVHGMMIKDDIVRAEYTSRSAALHSTGWGCYSIDEWTASSGYKNLQDSFVHGVVGGLGRSS